MPVLLAQVLDDPDAAKWVMWLNWGYWILLATCVGAVVWGGATLAVSENPDTGRRGRQLVAAGLAGAISLGILAPWINWCYDLIVS